MSTAATLHQQKGLIDNGNTLSISSTTGSIIVISDLHLASGLNESRNYDGTENFFSDTTFSRFLHFITIGEAEKSMLIINGDFIDYLRIRNIPSGEADFIEWQKILAEAGIVKSIDELKNSISDKEREYGLKTHDYKSIWKLHVCMKGHPAFFEALANWLGEGHRLCVITGNHDLEWYWPAIQKYLVHALWEIANGKHPEIVEAAFDNLVYYANDKVVINQKIWVEHGHIYENITAVKGDTLINNGTELNLPFGSFFNRYLINRLELAYPFLDNVRPTQKILPLLIRERFPLALQVLFKYIPFTIKIIPKKMYWQVFKYLFDIFIVIILPVLITAFAIWQQRGLFKGDGEPSFIVNQVLMVLRNFGFLFLSYIFGRLLAMARLSAPKSLFPFAKTILDENKSLEIITFGHSHTPEQCNYSNRWYFNTGTWMPVYDISMADVRLDKTFTYLYIQQNHNGEIISKELMRWNDDALRPENMVLKVRE